MKRILLIFLALTLLLLPACAEEPDMDVGKTVHTSRVNARRIAEYGDYVYYVAGRMYCYNRRTGEMRQVCTESDCSYACIFVAPIEFTQAVDGRLYFCSTNIRTREITYAYLDLVTEETTVLLTTIAHGSSVMSCPIVDNGWVYYTGQQLREGGKAENPDDYDFCVFRIPMDGGKSEFVCLIEDSADEQLWAIVDGKAITKCNFSIYSTDSVTGERKVLFVPEEHGYINHIEDYQYLDGYLYCRVRTDEIHPFSEYYPETHNKQYLLKIDVRTGETKQLVDVPVHNYIMTEDTIYYTEQTVRVIYVPEDYEKHPEKVVVTGSYETLYACDLNGENRREVLTDPYLDLNVGSHCIIDNCMYGTIYQYDETEHKMVDFFGKVDLKTGEVTPATEVK